jgi:hypothetical protein
LTWSARVDLYWAHIEDRTVPLDETVEAFGELAASGLAGRIGASNHAVWRVEQARGIAAAKRLPGWTALQLRDSYIRPRPGARRGLGAYAGRQEPGGGQLPGGVAGEDGQRERGRLQDGADDQRQLGSVTPPQHAEPSS